jgi:hypothetical protein
MMRRGTLAARASRANGVGRLVISQAAASIHGVTTPKWSATATQNTSGTSSQSATRKKL